MQIGVLPSHGFDRNRRGSPWIKHPHRGSGLGTLLRYSPLREGLYERHDRDSAGDRRHHHRDNHLFCRPQRPYRERAERSSAPPWSDARDRRKADMWAIITQIFPYAVAFTIPLLITSLGGPLQRTLRRRQYRTGRSHGSGILYQRSDNFQPLSRHGQRGGLDGTWCGGSGGCRFFTAPRLCQHQPQSANQVISGTANQYDRRRSYGFLCPQYHRFGKHPDRFRTLPPQHTPFKRPADCRPPSSLPRPIPPHGWSC